MGIGSSRRVAPEDVFSNETIARVSTYDGRSNEVNGFNREDIRDAYDAARSQSVVQAANVAQRRHSTQPSVTFDETASPRTRRASQEAIQSRNLNTRRARPGSAHAARRSDTQERFLPMPAGIDPEIAGMYGSRGSARLGGAIVDADGNLRDANTGGYTTHSAQGAVEAALLTTQPHRWNKRPNAHKGGIIAKPTGTVYALKQGEMVVPTARVKAVKKAMRKAKLKPIKNKI
jgi:hypothetical protein